MIHLFLPTLFSVALCFMTHTTETTFPSLTGETLEGKSITLPTDVMGKKSIIGMAYSTKSEAALMSWYEPLYDKFVTKVGMFDKDYDVRLYFVPMYIGLKQAAYESTKKQLKESHRTDLFPYVLFYKGELSPYDTQLGMTDKTQPYFFILDEQGKVLLKLEGSFSESKMEKIEAVLE
jgi:hypothetical protein